MVVLLTGTSASPVPLRAASASDRAEPAVAPPVALPGRAGETVTLDSPGARVVLVDFWASWCVPCRRSFPWMNELQKRYGARGLRIVAIDLDKERPAAEAFLAKHPAAFTVAFDAAGRTAEAFHVTGMPSTYLVAADGTILARHVGFDPKKTGELEARIEEACTP